MFDLHWKIFFDNSPLPYFVVQEGFIRLANTKMCEITGYPLRELIDLPLITLVFREDRPSVVNNVIYFQPGANQPGHFEFRINRYNGHVIYVQGHFSRILYLNNWAVLGQIIDITDRKVTEDEKKYTEERFKVLFEYAPDAYYLNDMMGNFVDGNRMAEKLVGYKREELIGKSFTKLLPAAMIPKGFKILTQNLLGKPTGPDELVLNCKDGSQIEVEVRNFPVKINNQTLLLGIARDISERKQAEAALRLSEERFSKAFNASPSPMVIFSSDGHFMDVNESFLRLSGYNRNEVIGCNLQELKLYQNDNVLSRLQHTMAEEGSVRDQEITLITKSGELRVGLISAEIIELDGQKCSICALSDITERKKAEEQLKYLSLHDALTGLYNRTYFEQEMRRIEGGRYHPVGIIVCDVNGLKLVNDTLGHDAGDTLLIAAAGVLKDSFREVDMVARIGGDEFAILLPNCDIQAVEGGCQRIRNAIDHYNENNPKLLLSMALGYTVSNNPQVRMNELFKEADNNMYREKLHSSKNARNAIVQTLMKALAARDFITDGHAERLQDLVTAVAEDIGLPSPSITALHLLAQFHDIGKVGIPDRILFKPGPLTFEEAAEMKRHCEIGHRIAQSSPDLAPIADWILKHHEWWNGKGFPLGLKGEDIPPECRILAIADAYDAMTSRRPYRTPVSQEAAVAELKRCAGTQFDPGLVRVFTQLAAKTKHKK